MDVFCDKITSKNIKIFSCENCDFKCSKKGDWNRHLLTLKHQNLTLSNACDKILHHTCDFCNKKYSSRNGLWHHKKKCEKKGNDPINKQMELCNQILQSTTQQLEPTDKDLVMLLIKENNELKNMMMEVIKTGTHNTYMNNSHNQTFNLNVFLNETCKDAMNIMDFVNSMEIGLDDLEKVGELGYVNGMTNIIIKNLKALDITKRPLHCTDVKREIMYIKDDNKWERETENKDRIKKALKYIMHKNAKMLNVFKEKYPDCIKSYSKRSDQYNKLVVEVLGGKGDNEPQHNEKIIRRIAREVTIDKSVLAL